MSRIAVGIGGGHGGAAAATAITVALILMASSPAAILTTTEAFAAASKSSSKDCKDIQFRTFESSSFVSTQAGNTITIETSQDKYSVKIDYFRDTGSYGVTYYKNGAADDPSGNVLLPGGQTITITLQTNEPISGSNYGYRTHVTLYNDKVSDCQILSGYVKGEDKMAFEIASIEQTDERPMIAKLTVQVPDASDVDKHFTKLLVDFPFSPEAQEYYLISHRVHVR